LHLEFFPIGMVIGVGLGIGIKPWLLLVEYTWPKTFNNEWMNNVYYLVPFLILATFFSIPSSEYDRQFWLPELLDRQNHWSAFNAYKPSSSSNKVIISLVSFLFHSNLLTSIYQKWNLVPRLFCAGKMLASPPLLILINNGFSGASPSSLLYIFKLKYISF